MTTMMIFIIMIRICSSFPRSLSPQCTDNQLILIMVGESDAQKANSFGIESDPPRIFIFDSKNENNFIGIGRGNPHDKNKIYKLEGSRLFCLKSNKDGTFRICSPEGTLYGLSSAKKIKQLGKDFILRGGKELGWEIIQAQR